MLAFFKDVKFLKAPPLMSVTDTGILTFNKAWQSWNAFFQIEMSEEGKLTSSKK